ncbi:MAG: hypothetical protein MUC97_11810 [Bernardetiaceae bacterium]|jgi:hypothetical protein|nr:hypothetical protein [Bernardetiaceae bacterium]
MEQEIEIDGHKYPVQDEAFPLSLTKPFMYGDNSLLVQKYLNQVYNAGLREHGIYGHATAEAVKKNLELTEITEERFAFISNYNFK